MPDTYAQCPKCKFKPPSPLPVDESCPACGVYVYKWGQPRPAPAHTGDEEGGRLASLFLPLEAMQPSVFYGRCFALALLAVWSWFLIACDYRDGEIFGSFMHAILLPIHEAGHVLFRPFGEFMTILGGSLFQFALPLGIATAFVVVNRDNFGAALGVWWASVSLLDLSPYIYDAFAPQLVLLGGHTGEEGPHDWIYLLGTLGQLRNSQHWGAFVHGLGSVGVVAALVWSAAVLWRQRAQVEAI
ncbi:MAG: hypothetical protein HY306_08065 [Nitrosomonadales bacterium]|nr:hypothetical protein [Nitrosomonadales bacterium]